jgi:hypothetical protein
LEKDHPKTIPAKFGLVWFRVFREKDLNVKVYGQRTEGRQVMAKAQTPFAMLAKNNIE